MIRKTIISLLIVLFLIPGLLSAAEAGQYQAFVLPAQGNGSLVSEIFILDTQDGYMWTWVQSPSVGLILIYQGKLKPGSKMGDIIEVREVR